MKLKHKIILITAVITFGIAMVYFASWRSERCEIRSNKTLAEAKQELAHQLDVEPGDLTVYWSGEYRKGSQYRYRIHQSSGYYTAHTHSVEPRNEDPVIESEKVKKLVHKSVALSDDADRWIWVAFFGILSVVFGAIAIPINIGLEIYRKMR